MAIACDICGGTLSMDASGEFALCDSCGMKYTKDRIKAMTQKVASPVEVSNIAGIESMMKRGYLALEDADWSKAYNYFDKVLDINAEYAPAYIGKLCSELHFTNEAMLSKRLLLKNYPNYQKALRFAKEEYLAKIKTYDQLNREFFITKKQRFENIQKQIAKKEQSAILPQNGTVSISGKEHTITLAADGSVKGDGCEMEIIPAEHYRPGGTYTPSHTTKGCEIIYDYCTAYAEFDSGKFFSSTSKPSWFNKDEHIFAIATSDYHAVLLKLNETVIACGRNKHKQCKTKNWSDIVAISAGDEFSIGLKDDGTVVAAGNYPRNIILWKNIVMIYASGEYVVGLKSDDTFVAAGQGFNVSGSEEQIIAKLLTEQKLLIEQERKEKEEREFLEKQRIEQQERKEKEERELLEKQQIERERKEKEELKKKKQKQIFLNALFVVLGLGIVIAIFNSKPATNETPNENSKSITEKIITDPRDNKTYRTIKIGNQTWMAENLNYEIEDSKCYDHNFANCQKYGRLYHWKSALKSCPSGWHLPKDYEWEALANFIGSDAGRKLKAKSGWNSNGTDEYGFSALPSGTGKSDGTFIMLGSYGYWWSIGEGTDAYYRYISSENNNLNKIKSTKNGLFPIRCLQD